MNTTQIPQTDSIEELAAFWDTHDLTDFEQALEEVTEPVFEWNRAATVAVPFQAQELELLKRLAQAQGVGHTTLIRAWVLERLHPVG